MTDSLYPNHSGPVAQLPPLDRRILHPDEAQRMRDLVLVVISHRRLLQRYAVSPEMREVLAEMERASRELERQLLPFCPTPGTP